MGCKVVFFSFLVTSSAFVECFPYPEGNLDGASYQIRFPQRDPRYFQSPPNVGSLWPRNQGIAQSTQNQVFAWNPKSYNDIGRQQIESSKSAIPANIYGYGQQINGYDNVTPVATLQNGYNQWPNVLSVPNSTPNPHNLNKGWWNNQNLHQQQQGQLYGKPYEENTFVQNNAKPFVNQANYGQEYYQPAGMIDSKPVNNFNNYRPGWLPQNQYSYVSTPAPNAVGYLPWPIPDKQEAQPTEFNSPSEYIKPEPENNQSSNLGKTPPESVQSDGQEPILASQQPVKNQTNIPKHYIIVHMDRTQERIYDLDDIIVDEFNVAHVKSKGVPVMAIIEVEEPINETEKPSTLEVPYDTGIMKIPRDADRNSNKHDSPGKLQSHRYPFVQTTTEDTTYDMNYFKPEYIMPIQPTTENVIDSTTNSSPQTAITIGNIDTDKNGSVTYSTTEKTVVSTIDGITKSTNDSITKSTTDSTSHSTTENTTESGTDDTKNSIIDSTIIRTADSSTYAIGTSTKLSQYPAGTNDKNQEYILNTQTTEIPQRAQIYNYKNYGDFDSNEENKNNTRNTKSYTTQQASRIHRNKHGNGFGGFDTIKSRNLPKWTINNRGYGPDKPTSNESEQKPNDNDALDLTQSGESTSATDSPETSEAKSDLENENDSKKNKPSNNREPYKLREDLEIDISELKTVMDKPYIWFRPDDDFWNKVTKGEQAFDAVTFYDVHCKPKLIERETTIHQYANGTESVEYVETIWDSPDGGPKSKLI